MLIVYQIPFIIALAKNSRVIYPVIMQNLSKDQVIKIMEHYGNDPQQLVAVLLDIQKASGKNYVEKKWAELASDVMNVPLSKVFDVLTFYAMFSTEPRGEYIIEICKSTPCHFSGGAETAKWFEEAAGVKVGETTADGKITLIYSSCFGACEIAPAVKIGDDVFGSLTQDKVKTLVSYCREGKIQELEALCQN
jgi:NADH-quinone oxidoreductase subunit E